MATQANFRQRQTLARFPSMTPARPAAAPQSVSQPSQEPSTKGRPEANGDQDSIIGRGQTPGSLAGDEDQGLAEQPSSDRPASIQEAQAVPEVERGINGAKSPTASGHFTIPSKIGHRKKARVTYHLRCTLPVLPSRQECGRSSIRIIIKNCLKRI